MHNPRHRLACCITYLKTLLDGQDQLGYNLTNTYALPVVQARVHSTEPLIIAYKVSTFYGGPGTQHAEAQREGKTICLKGVSSASVKSTHMRAFGRLFPRR